MADVQIDISGEPFDETELAIVEDGTSGIAIVFGSFRVNLNNEQFVHLMEALRPWMPDSPLSPVEEK